MTFFLAAVCHLHHNRLAASIAFQLSPPSLLHQSSLRPTFQIHHLYGSILSSFLTNPSPFHPFFLSFFFLNLKLGCIFVRLYNNVSCLVHGKCRTKIHHYSSNLPFYSRYMSHINFSPSFWTSSYLLQNIPVCSGQENIKYGLV